MIPNFAQFKNDIKVVRAQMYVDIADFWIKMIADRLEERLTVNQVKEHETLRLLFVADHVHKYKELTVEERNIVAGIVADQFKSEGWDPSIKIEYDTVGDSYDYLVFEQKMN